MSASLVAQRRSYSLLSRRCWPCQANVLSTTHRRGSTRNPVGGIQPDMPQARKLGTHPRAQHELHAVAIHDVRWMHDGAQDHSLRVDQHVALASLHLLAPIVATQSPHAGGLHRLTVDAAGAG